MLNRIIVVNKQYSKLVYRKRIIDIAKKYLKPFDCVKMNTYCWIEIVLNSNTCNHFPVCKQMINIE